MNIWDTESIPSIGISEPKIKERFSKLNDYPIDDFVIEDENYPNYLGIIKNFSKAGSGVNQFFPYSNQKLVEVKLKHYQCMIFLIKTFHKISNSR